QAIEFIRTNAPDVLIACGSGSVHDITRYAAYKEKLSFLSYPTAASVDGFISGVAAMTWYGQKLTFPAAPPLAVFAVPAVFCSAPSRLTASGAGDVLGKYTSLFDWKAAEILTGETCCSGICGLEYQAMDDLCRALKNRRPETEREYTVKVMEALLLSGLAMQLAGNSRPASGAEHHLSHLWEMHCINEESDALHGEKVGIGLLHVLREYHKKAAVLDPEKIRAMDLARVFDRARLEPVFASLTDGILAENLPGGRSSLADIQLTAETVPALQKAVQTLPTAEEAEKLLKAAGAPVSNAEIGLPNDAEFIEKSLAYAPYVRNRLTLLKVLSACMD
ncbi:MAG: iron-containing alcohol dehydrogenase, partial [Eubacteriales bacterium]